MFSAYCAYGTFINRAVAGIIKGYPAIVTHFPFFIELIAQTITQVIIITWIGSYCILLQD
jgi:hypothetical protein